MSRTSNKGRFQVTLHNAPIINDIYLSILPSHADSTDILIDNGFSATVPLWFPTSFYLDSSNRKLIEKMLFYQQINSVFDVKDDSVIDYNVHYSSVFGNNLEEIRITDYVQLNSMLEVLREITPHVRISECNNNDTLTMYDDKLNIKYDYPLLFVDQIPYYNINKLLDLQATEVDMIRVSNHKYLYGNEEINGIISITSNTGNFAGLPLSNNGVFVEYPGFQKPTKFVSYLERYDNSGKPYFPTTLEWETLYQYADTINLLLPNNNDNYRLIITSLNNRKNRLLDKVIAK